MECLVRNFDIRTINLPYADLGPSTSSDCKDTDRSDKLSSGELVNNDPKTNAVPTSETDCEAATAIDNSMEIDSSSNSVDNDRQASTDTAEKLDGEEKKKNTRHDFDLIGQKDGTNFFFKTGAPPLQMPGHTGFLTFATLYPS